jgi:hypothetical protein
VKRHSDGILRDVALGFALVAGLTGGLAVYNQFDNLRDNLTARCEQRVPFDQRAVEFRQALLQWHEDYIDIEKDNPFIDEKVRQRRIAASQEVIDKGNAAFAAMPPSAQGCKDY